MMMEDEESLESNVGRSTCSVHETTVGPLIDAWAQYWNYGDFCAAMDGFKGRYLSSVVRQVRLESR